jgi:glycine cleavage system transcriptional repressor
MRKHMILTASGRDRPGVLEEFTDLLLKHDGNVDASRMAHLGDEFAILMLVSVPEDKVEGLQMAAAELRKADYEVHTRLTEVSDAPSDPASYACGITVTGADHMGIIHHFARGLADNGVNVETLNTEVMAAPMSGTPLFTMSAVVTVPREVPVDRLREVLERIGDELGVNTSVLSHVS